MTVLKPQDIFVVLKLRCLGDIPLAYNDFAQSVHMSPSEVHAVIQRLRKASLTKPDDFGKYRPDIDRLGEFLVHGIKYVFLPARGELTQGIPTGFAASPLSELRPPSDDAQRVWPHPDGPARGIAFTPLYKTAPQAALKDPKRYELLALVDVLRDRRDEEEGEAAAWELAKRLGIF